MSLLIRHIELSSLISYFTENVVVINLFNSNNNLIFIYIQIYCVSYTLLLVIKIPPYICVACDKIEEENEAKLIYRKSIPNNKLCVSSVCDEIEIVQLIKSVCILEWAILKLTLKLKSPTQIHTE